MRTKSLALQEKLEQMLDIQKTAGAGWGANSNHLPDTPSSGRFR